MEDLDEQNRKRHQRVSAASDGAGYAGFLYCFSSFCQYPFSERYNDFGNPAQWFESVIRLSDTPHGRRYSEAEGYSEKDGGAVSEKTGRMEQPEAGSAL